MKKNALIAILLSIVPAVSQAWWNDDWQYRKQLNLNTTAGTGADIQGTTSDVPVLVRLHTGNFNYFLDLAQKAADVRFVASDDKTVLKYHIEKFDPINEMALIWVKVPTLNGGANAQSIWMYYGNPAATSAEDAAGSYDVNQTLVYHFSDNGAPDDNTAYKNNPVLFTAQPNPAALISSGASFKGNGIVTVKGSPSLMIKPDSGWTFSTWIKIDATQNDGTVVQATDGKQSFTIAIDTTNAYARVVNVSGKSFETPHTANLTIGAWHHLAAVLGSSKLALYVDGVELAATPASFDTMNGNITFGNNANGSHFFTGELDEIQISNIARSSDWIKAASEIQGPDARLLTYGGDEKRESSSGTESYFGIILKNVTVDGWAVIVVLAMMAIISWIVMFGKGVFIHRVDKDNKKFIDEFKRLGATDPSALDHDDTEDDKAFDDSPIAASLFGKHDNFQTSTIFRIYHTGVQEVNHRMGRAVGAQATSLGSQAVDTIRAGLDATLVREAQKLNKQMVLLTIAISGGPFLGLLGTVVGVMITFAAIAASGDVNVNAIAPGIAAALVATVAGLGVAIPALFGYNYLNSRIKEINADMHVFVDEYIAKIAEYYAK